MKQRGVLMDSFKGSGSDQVQLGHPFQIEHTLSFKKFVASSLVSGGHVSGL